MRAIVTGQIGMDKKPFINAAAAFSGEQGEALHVFHVGDRMYKEALDVRPGKILDLPISRLNSLRRAAFKDILADSREMDNVVVNTHATFRWRHGLFSAFDYDQIERLAADRAGRAKDRQRSHPAHPVSAKTQAPAIATGTSPSRRSITPP